jgi:uncharacterized protein (DUF924 family)
VTRLPLEEVRDFWFKDACTSPALLSKHQTRWFSPSNQLDREIEERFGVLPDAAKSGTLAYRPDDPHDLLAVILILDQFPRQIYRNTPQAFAYDSVARTICSTMIEKSLFKVLHPVEQTFAFLPLEHSERLSDQSLSVQLYETLWQQSTGSYQSFLRNALDYARRHHSIIERFGRFPHRNTILKRETTRREARFLAAGGDTFGVDSAASSAQENNTP